MPSSEAHGRSTDPYRIFFPLGVLLGIAGVLLWPLYYWHVIDWYDGRAHAFVQTDCFLYAFIAGFLWTAVPRFTGASAPRRPIQFAVAALILAQAVAFELRIFPVGHLIFIVAHLIVIGVMVRCFAERQQSPPEP